MVGLFCAAVRLSGLVAEESRTADWAYVPFASFYFKRRRPCNGRPPFHERVPQSSSLATTARLGHGFVLLSEMPLGQQRRGTVLPTDSDGHGIPAGVLEHESLFFSFFLEYHTESQYLRYCALRRCTHEK